MRPLFINLLVCPLEGLALLAIALPVLTINQPCQRLKSSKIKEIVVSDSPGAKPSCPSLLLTTLEKPKVIATTASLFILINSISGILGQFTKENTFYELTNYWTLFLSVLIGGFIGNYLNLKILSNRTLTIMTSLLVIFVSIRIGIKLFL